MRFFPFFLFLSLICLSLTVPLSPLIAAEAVVSLEGVPPDQVNSVLAKLSDEQVRSLLVSELAKDLAPGDKNSGKNTGLVGKTANMLHVLDNTESDNEHAIGFLSAVVNMPRNYIAMIKKNGNGSVSTFFSIIGLVLLVFGAAWCTEFFARRFTANFREQFQKKAIPDLDGPMRFIAGLMLAIPNFIHLLIFSAAAFLFFFLLPISEISHSRLIFMAIFSVILFHRTLSNILRIFLAPHSEALRVFPLDDKVAQTVQASILFLCSYTFSAITTLALLKELHLDKKSLNMMVMVLATILILLILNMVLRSRHYVKNQILAKSELNQTRNWVVEQFAQFWHIPALFYFIVIWGIMVGDELTGVRRGNSAFLMSILLLPLFIVFNSLGQWVVRVAINTLRIYNPEDEESSDPEIQQKLAESKERERKLYVTTSRGMTLAILATLLIWVMSLWDIHIPYASDLTNAVFQSLIALAFGLTAWRFASSYIERKMLESAPKTEESGESDDEWGGAAARGRSFTLLPMLRKFIASVLLVMVVLVILSSLGVDIGPLLAGAGVVGIAVGFGAQKLVSDVFSGFFYLLDDAFRVGEFIKAGSVSGAVESITLRNVMLRHPRGMLQIVPHSQLGSITNFMRGGIIEKFNLEFPYDTNVNKIRKVIKKVGQTMLADEEFKEDFIQPIKSAGVREMSGSIMVIRVKFKVHPGAQFVIKREAFRRITEALAAQGIHYAHRKVIVELPEQQNTEPTEEQKKLLEAGAAAATIQQIEEEKKIAEQLKQK